jgi:ferredoxin, 2Fe-2S
MSLITILPSGKQVEAAEGTTILAAILQADPDFVTKCGGNAKCGKCHFFLLEGRKGVSKIGSDENALLDSYVGVGSKSRFACQAKVLGTEDIKIEIPTV